nr:MAG TPA: hypothetical protein [Caudoviricetes sp.]
MVFIGVIFLPTHIVVVSFKDIAPTEWRYGNASKIILWMF